MSRETTCRDQKHSNPVISASPAIYHNYIVLMSGTVEYSSLDGVTSDDPFL